MLFRMMLIVLFLIASLAAGTAHAFDIDSLASSIQGKSNPEDWVTKDQVPQYDEAKESDPASLEDSTASQNMLDLATTVTNPQYSYTCSTTRTVKKQTIYKCDADGYQYLTAEACAESCFTSYQCNKEACTEVQSSCYEADPTCEGNGTLDAGTDKCQTPPDPQCPSDYMYAEDCANQPYSTSMTCAWGYQDAGSQLCLKTTKDNTDYTRYVGEGSCLGTSGEIQTGSIYEEGRCSIINPYKWAVFTKINNDVCQNSQTYYDDCGCSGLGGSPPSGCYANKSCPPGFTPDSASGTCSKTLTSCTQDKCVAPPQCPNGTSQMSDGCYETQQGTCPAGSSPYSNVCVSTQRQYSDYATPTGQLSCDGTPEYSRGRCSTSIPYKYVTFLSNATDSACHNSQTYYDDCGCNSLGGSPPNGCFVNPTCPVGWQQDYSTNTCYLYAQRACPSGVESYNGGSNICETSPTMCTGTYQYDESSSICNASPTCSAGSYDSATDKCYSPCSTFICPLDGSQYTSQEYCQSACPSYICSKDTVRYGSQYSCEQSCKEGGTCIEN